MNDSDSTTKFSNVISPHSISVYGGSVGHSRISENALIALSYDVTYKLYEVLKECKTEMNIYRQTRLSTTILDNVFQSFGIPTLYGNKILIPYVSIPNSDMSVLHLTKIDLLEEASNDTVKIEPEPVPFIKGIYVSPLTKICGISNVMKSLDTMNESVVKLEPKSETDDDDLSNYSQNKMSNLRENENLNIPQFISQCAMQSVNQKETDYYLVVSQIVLNSSENLFKAVLEDLRTNPRLGSVYCSLLNLVSNSVKYFKCVGKLISRLLRTVGALLDNQYIDASSSFSVDEAINALCTIVLDPKIANDTDDFLYRRKASYLLMRALNTWNIGLEDRKKILCTLKKTFTSPEKMSLKSNYSMLIMFHGLGYDVLDLHFWPSLSKYLNVLSSLDEIISGKQSILLTNDICYVKSALLLVAGILYRNFWSPDPFVLRLHIEADMLLTEYFGECLLPVRAYAIPRARPLFSTVNQKRTSKDTAIDIEKNYRNIQLYAFRKKFHSSDVSIIKKTRRNNFPLSEIFEFPSRPPRNRVIIFNFIGSNQISFNQLRTKKVDSRYNVQWLGQQIGPFLKYEKKIRCIKYCTTKKFCTGDINLFI